MKPSICIWEDIKLVDVTEIIKCEDADDLKGLICNIFDLPLHQISSKERILLDLYFHTLLFAKENNFNEEQTSAFFSIVKKTHEKAIETPFGNLENTYNYFKSMLLCHSVKRPPFCVHLFQLNEVTKISDYMTKTYFRHFKLYKYAFTPKVTLNLSISYDGLLDEIEQTESSLEQPSEDNNIDKEDYSGVAEEDETSKAMLEDNGQDAGESTAVKELKSIIESAIDEQVSKLRVSIDEKLKMNEANVMSRIGETNKAVLSPPKNEKKGKKK